MPIVDLIHARCADYFNMPFAHRLSYEKPSFAKAHQYVSYAHIWRPYPKIYRSWTWSDTKEALDVLFARGVLRTVLSVEYEMLGMDELIYAKGPRWVFEPIPDIAGIRPVKGREFRPQNKFPERGVNPLTADETPRKPTNSD